MIVQKNEKSRVKTKATVSHNGLKEVGVACPSVQTVHKIPPPSHLREEGRIQEEVQNRLRHLADNIKAGMGKIKSQG